jgi:hypothetical protein
MLPMRLANHSRPPGPASGSAGRRTFVRGARPS